MLPTISCKKLANNLKNVWWQWPIVFVIVIDIVVLCILRCDGSSVVIINSVSYCHHDSRVFVLGI